MKLGKRIAALGAAMVMAVSMMSIGSSAYNTSEPWTARWINQPNIPSSLQTYSVKTIAYSTYGAIAYRTGYSNSVNGGSGNTHVNCDNGEMPQKTIPYSDYVVCNPVFHGVIYGATYRITAKTTTTNNTYNCWGNIVTKTS